MSANRHLIETEKLFYSYPNGVCALDSVTLQVGSGEFVAVVGGNGSGKSTLLRLLNGELSPSSGTIKVDGADPTSTRDERRRILGLVSQDEARISHQGPPNEQFLTGSKIETPSENRTQLVRHVGNASTVLEMIEHSRLPPVIVRDRVEEKMTFVSVGSTSQRVLALDQPTIRLDFRASLAFMRLMKELTNQGYSVIIATHDMRLVADFAGRVVVLRNGKVIADGTPRKILTDEKLLLSTALREPQVTRLAQRLGRLGVSPEVMSNAELISYLSKLAITRKGRQEDENTEIREGIPSSAETILAALDFGWRYESSSKWILQGLSISIRKGQFVAIVGPNNSGKSTLLRTFAGALHRSGHGFARGRIQIEGRNLEEYETSSLASTVGLVSDDLKFEHPASNVIEAVMSGITDPYITSEDRIKKTQSVISALKLSGVRELEIRQLSEGQRERVRFARVLTNAPKVLLLDEPFFQMDPESKHDLFYVLSSLKQGKTTILIVDDDLQEFALLLDRVIQLDDGTIRFDGSPRDFFAGGRDLISYGVRPLDVASLFEELRHTVKDLQGKTPLYEMEAAVSITQAFE